MDKKIHFVLCGSTGQPKGMHTSGGGMVYTATTHKYIFDYHEEDIYFCAADIGWITGHSWCLRTTRKWSNHHDVWYSNLSNPDRYWQVMKNEIINFTAPTAIRTAAPGGMAK